MSRSRSTALDHRAVDARYGRLLVWSPVLAWFVAAACFLALGLAVDLSNLEEEPDSWGYLFGAVGVPLFYGGPFLVALIVCAVVGSVLDSPQAQRQMAIAGAVVVASCGLGLAVFAVSQIRGDYQASQVFGVGALVIALTLLLPLVLCLRARRV